MMKTPIKSFLAIVFSLSLTGCASTSLQSFVGNVLDGASQNMDSREQRQKQLGRSTDQIKPELIDVFSGVIKAGVEPLIKNDSSKAKQSEVCINRCVVK